MKRTFETMCGISPRIHELDVGRPLYKFAREVKPSGYICTTWAECVAIWLVDGCGDECIAAWENDSGSFSGVARHCIYYTSAGDPYIRKGGQRWYFSNALRAA